MDALDVFNQRRMQQQPNLHANWSCAAHDVLTLQVVLRTTLMCICTSLESQVLATFPENVRARRLAPVRDIRRARLAWDSGSCGGFEAFAQRRVLTPQTFRHGGCVTVYALVFEVCGGKWRLRPTGLNRRGDPQLTAQGGVSLCLCPEYVRRAKHYGTSSPFCNRVEHGITL